VRTGSGFRTSLVACIHYRQAGLTVGSVDPFVALAAGRSLFRVADLIELARQIDGWKSERVERTVKENMS